MLSIIIQSNIETKERLDGLNKSGIGDSELIAKIDEATILVEEAQFHTINSDAQKTLQNLYFSPGSVMILKIQSFIPRLLSMTAISYP